MSRSTKKSITVPNPVREGLTAQLKAGTLDYPSENAAWIGLARYQLLSGKPHPITAAISRMHPDDQDAIGYFLLETTKRGLTLKGQIMSHLIRGAITGTTTPTDQEIANLLPQELLKLAREWQKKPEKVMAALSRKSAK